MKLTFSKYVATGNDFIVIDNRSGLYDARDKSTWERLCKTKWGIGADGVLLVERSIKKDVDFKMRYLNSDGSEVSMCGNGARAITAFYDQECAGGKQAYSFETTNGIYQCEKDSKLWFRVMMTELYDIGKINLKAIVRDANNSLYLNTGVPHCVFEVKNLKNYPVFEEGKRIRNLPLFEKGVNVNFFERQSGNIFNVRTYERGVENETLACGTGATAVAVAVAEFFNLKDEVILNVPGGTLVVRFSSDFKRLELCGSAEHVFQGQINI